MRLVLIGLVTMAAGLAADLQAASAQNESFFQHRYCARHGGVPGQLSCPYDTLEQCRMIFEPMRYCMENPWWHAATANDTSQESSARFRSRLLHGMTSPPPAVCLKQEGDAGVAGVVISGVG